MIRHLPKFQYRGLTIVVSKLSRFDRGSILEDGNGAIYFKKECLYPHLNRYQCDIRQEDDKAPLLTGTTCILFLGFTAFKKWLNTSLSFNKQRGGLYYYKDIPTITTYHPQDACDFRAYDDIILGTEEEDIGEGEENLAEAKDYGATQRKNWRFWCVKDCHKAAKISQEGVPAKDSFTFEIYPPEFDVIKELTETKGKDFYLDIETDREYNMLCFAYNFYGSNTVSCVPTIDHNYQPAYSEIGKIHRALAIALRDNTTVAHNGAAFDFFVLAWKYKLAVRRTYDTMLAQSRIFPGREKSLGHCISLYLYEPYHKDESDFSYRTPAAAERLYTYCAKDVSTLRMVKEAQLKYAQSIEGQVESIEQINDSIEVYLTASLQGIAYDQNKLQETMLYNDKMMTQYLRIMQRLMGKSVEPLISNLKCSRYFHDMLGYPPVMLTNKSKKPSYDANALYKLKVSKTLLENPNPVLDFLIAYREIKKQSGSLKFEPWKTDNTCHETHAPTSSGLQ